MSTPEQRTAAWIRVFLIVTGFLAVFLVGVALLLGRSNEPISRWVEECRVHLAEEAGQGNALAPLLEALEKADWESLDRQRELLRRVATEGWDPEAGRRMEPLLASHQGMFAAVTRSASQPNFSLPRTSDRGIEMARPDFESMEVFGLLLVTNAMELQSRGRNAEAAQRLMEVAILGARFCSPEDEATLVGHVIGNALLELSANALVRVMADGTLPPAVLERVAAQLAEIETQRRLFAEGLRAEIETWAAEVETRGDDLAELSELLQLYRPELSPGEARELATEYSGFASAAPDEIERIWSSVWQEFMRPYQERALPEVEELRSASENPLAVFYIPEVRRYAWRGAYSTARLRLAQAMALMLLGEGSLAGTLTDPFTGESIRIGENLIWFPGPDGDDDGGEVRHDPTKGPDADGDLLVRW